MTVITYKAPHLFLRFAELVQEQRKFVKDLALVDLSAIKELMVDYVATHLGMFEAVVLDRGVGSRNRLVVGDSPLKRFCDLLRDEEALLALRDPNYRELHRIADACVAWARVHCGVDLVERVRAVMRLKGPPMRETDA